MSTRRIPLRKCIGCNEMKPKTELIRVIRNAEENVELDGTGRKNGRGAYLCRDTACLLKAEKNKGLEHSLKMAIPKEVYEALEKELNSLGSEE